MTTRLLKILTCVSLLLSTVTQAEPSSSGLMKKKKYRGQSVQATVGQKTGQKAAQKPVQKTLKMTSLKTQKSSGVASPAQAKATETLPGQTPISPTLNPTGQSQQPTQNSFFPARPNMANELSSRPVLKKAQIKAPSQQIPIGFSRPRGFESQVYAQGETERSEMKMKEANPTNSKIPTSQDYESTGSSLDTGILQGISNDFYLGARFGYSNSSQYSIEESADGNVLSQGRSKGTGFKDPMITAGRSFQFARTQFLAEFTVSPPAGSKEVKVISEAEIESNASSGGWSYIPSLGFSADLGPVLLGTRLDYQFRDPRTVKFNYELLGQSKTAEARVVGGNGTRVQLVLETPGLLRWSLMAEYLHMDETESAGRVTGATSMVRGIAGLGIPLNRSFLLKPTVSYGQYTALDSGSFDVESSSTMSGGLLAVWLF